MKVIDLLNKIANGEELPKIIKYNDYILYYVKDMKDYYDGKGNHPLLDTQCQFILNDEVEIIEDTPKEDKKIEKLDLEELNDLLRADLSYDNLFHKTHKMLVETKSKLNEIIDKINDKDAQKKIEQIGKSYDIVHYSQEDDTYNYDMEELIDMVQDIYNKQSEIIDRLNGEENDKN